MTEDTIFDMASLTKCLATATAIMQLYEQGKLQFDDPVVKYLPEFAANGKEKVTIRSSSPTTPACPPDVNLKDPWGLAAPDKAEGIHRAMNATLYQPPRHKPSSTPTSTSSPSEPSSKNSAAEPLDVYASKHIFRPLGMTRPAIYP